MLPIATAAYGQNADLSADIANDRQELLSQSSDRLYTLAHPVARPAGPFVPFAYNPVLKAGEEALYLTLDIPTTRISHPGNIQTAATTNRLDTKLQLTAAHQFDSSKLSLVSTADFDRYAHTAEANGNGLQSIVKWAASSQPAAPYLFYQSSLGFTTNFDRTKSNLNDIGAGSKFNLDKYPLDNGFTWTSSIDVNFTRRSQHSGPGSQSLLGKVNLGLAKGDEFSAAFAPSIRQRWFDTGRRDHTLIAPIQLAWDPAALLKVHGEIQLNLVGNRNYSTDSSKRSKQWEFGPTLEVVLVFL